MQYLNDVYSVQLGVGLVFAIIMGAVCAIIGSRKGRSTVGFFFMGFFLGLIGLIIALVLKPKTN